MATLRLDLPSDAPAGHDGEVLACAFTPDGGAVLSGGWDGSLRLWDAAAGVAVESFYVNDKPISACAASPDGKLWLAGTMEGMLIVWDAVGRVQRSMFLAHTRPVSALVFSPDGARLASVSWDRNVSLWSVDVKVEGRPLGHHADIAAGCCFTADGKYLVSWSYDGTAAVWDVATAQTLAQLRGHADRITAGAVAPDGRWLLTGCRDGEVKLWDLHYAGQEVNSVPLQAEVRACLVLLDGASAVVADANGRLTLHSLPDLRILDELQARLSVQTAALAPSGAQVALGAADGCVYLVAVDGFDRLPLAVTATPGVRRTAGVLGRLFGRHRETAVYRCTCPACRADFEIDADHGKPSAPCPGCGRSVRVCAVTNPGPAAPAVR